MNKKRKIDADREAFMLANAQDMTIQDFADAFDVSQTAVRNTGKKLGLTFKPGKELRRMSSYEVFDRARKVPAYGERAVERPAAQYSNLPSPMGIYRS